MVSNIDKLWLISTINLSELELAHENQAAAESNGNSSNKKQLNDVKTSIKNLVLGN